MVRLHRRAFALTATLAAAAALATLLPTWSLASNAAGQAFLDENAEREEVIVLESGLQYEILQSADNRDELEGPTATEPCVCQYKGMTIDGTVFDSSYDRDEPATFAPNQVIKGWTEALQLMRPGDKWTLYVPSELAYGEKKRGKTIKPGDVLIFELELLEVKKGESVGMFSNLPLLGNLDKPLIEGWSWPSRGQGLIFFCVMLYLFSAKKSSGGARKVAVRHILVKSQALASSLKEQLDDGSASFADLAKAHSTCPSKTRGGFLGKFGAGVMVPAFEQVCWAAPVKVVQGPVQTQFGFHLIEVLERDAPLPPPASSPPAGVQFKSAGSASAQADPKGEKAE